MEVTIFTRDVTKLSNDERRLPLRYCKRQTPSTLGLLTTHKKIKWRWPPLLSKYSYDFDS
jgi:hypothetical protein